MGGSGFLWKFFPFLVLAKIVMILEKILFIKTLQQLTKIGTKLA